jgi:hypothetical protein
MNLFRSALNACVVNGLTYTKIFLCSNDTSRVPVSTTRTTDSRSIATSPLTVRLPPITLATLNQSLRNFTHGRIQ